VVKIHEEIPYEKKRRAFSPKYLNLKQEEGIDPNQMSKVLQKSTTFKNKTVVDLVNEVASGKVPLSDQCRCCRETTTMQQPLPVIFPIPLAMAAPENYEITFLTPCMCR
jgi:hypothetical protein